MASLLLQKAMLALAYILPTAIAVPLSHSAHANAALDLLPFATNGRNILTCAGDNFLYAGTNLPGHQEIMIPEGLQYASAAELAQRVADLGLNSVRMTFAIEMVNDILESSTGVEDVQLRDAVIGALGETNGTKVLAQILERNAEFTETMGRLEVFDAVATAFADKGIVVHLDNHVSEAVWCCGENDGNRWFGERYFDVQKWVNAWSYMARHAAENWPSFGSVGLRNELRRSNVSEPYDWYTWNLHMTQAANAVHNAAPDALIFFSGLDYDVDISPLPLGKTLNGTSGTSTEGKTAVFDPSALAYTNKIVLEIHKYDFENTQDDCATFAAKWYPKGFQALDAENPDTKYLFPVVLTEWGFIQNGTYWNQTTYNRCLVEFVEEWKFGWTQWAVAGSYYIRTRNGASTQDDDEAWGLLNHTWIGVRSQVTVDNSLQRLIKALES